MAALGVSEKVRKILDSTENYDNQALLIVIQN
jgi:hypothetical protein